MDAEEWRSRIMNPETYGVEVILQVGSELISRTMQVQNRSYDKAIWATKEILSQEGYASDVLNTAKVIGVHFEE